MSRWQVLVDRNGDAADAAAVLTEKGEEVLQAELNTWMQQVILTQTKVDERVIKRLSEWEVGTVD
jgi:hypothetical protein